jgi:hypothetical protein
MGRAKLAVPRGGVESTIEGRARVVGPEATGVGRSPAPLSGEVRFPGGAQFLDRGPRQFLPQFRLVASLAQGGVEFAVDPGAVLGG